MKSYIPKIILAVFLLALLGLAVFTYTIYKKNPPTQKTLPLNSQSKQGANFPNQNNPNAVQTAPSSSTSSSDNAPAGSSTQEQTNGNSASDNTKNNSAGNSSAGQNNSTPPQVSVDNKNAGTGQMLAHITTEHCTSDCKAFANNLALLEYCQQVCGLIPVQPVTNCDGKSGIYKDYCLKDLGITKNDPSICNQINDVNIKQTCQNRIAQDIIENQ